MARTKAFKRPIAYFSPLVDSTIAVLHRGHVQFGNGLNQLIFRGKKLVNVGRRHFELAGDIRHRRLIEPEPVKKFIRLVENARSGLIARGYF